MRVVAVEWLKGSRSAPDGIETCTAYKAVGSLNESGCMAISREETRGQWPCRTCGELKVNKQLTISKILNFLSKHLCFEQFQCLKPPSGLFEKSKQTAETKQTADHLRNSKFSFQTSLLLADLVLEASKWLFCEK